ncbi:MAG: nuclear transport factor 2 family protein [Gemmatimonadota bacterium]
MRRRAALTLACLAVFGRTGLNAQQARDSTREGTDAVAAPAADSSAAGSVKLTPEEEVLSVVRALFDAMRARDSAAVRAVFNEDARLVTTIDRAGVPAVRLSTIDGFVEVIASATADLDERIRDPEVRIDDDLATVWTPYAFFLDGEFSHCGVDAFLLTRTRDGWKIVHIADTRRRADCDPGSFP